MMEQADDWCWYFTAPWEPVPIRRGDALGFRAGADYFADILAPGLSNATVDARWISLLSWCLKWSDLAWRKAGNGDPISREEQSARYKWLRPLELLWVARALESGQSTGWLPGLRSVEPWRKEGCRIPAGEGEFRFGMTDKQFSRYRQTGAYGAYRVLFRTVEGLTKGDGWTPGAIAEQLAKLVNDSLASDNPATDARLTEKDFEKTTRWSLWKNQEARYWADPANGRWKNWRENLESGFLPTPRDAVNRLKEGSLLAKVLFGAGAAGFMRRATAEVLASAKADSHAGLVDALASSDTLAKMLSTPGALAPLPAFTRFADAAMYAMRSLWHEMKDEKTPAIGKVADRLQKGLESAHDAGIEWLKVSVGIRDAFRHGAVVTQLAQAMRDARTPLDQLCALMAHHQAHGGGLRWFREQDGKIVPLAPYRGVTRSDYRFRLYPLSRLAAQCGVARMDNVFDALGRNGFDDFDDVDEETSDEQGDAQ